MTVEIRISGGPFEVSDIADKIAEILETTTPIEFWADGSVQYMFEAKMKQEDPE